MGRHLKDPACATNGRGRPSQAPNEPTGAIGRDVKKKKNGGTSDNLLLSDILVEEVVVKFVL